MIYKHYYNTILLIGVYVGNIISFPFSAVLCEYGFAGGWPSVFYIFGMLCINLLNIIYG